LKSSQAHIYQSGRHLLKPGGGVCCNPIGEVGEKKKEINKREKNTSVLLSTLSPVYLALIIQVSNVMW